MPSREGCRSAPSGGVFSPLSPNARERDTGQVFARYFIELPMSPEQVTAALARHPEEWLPGLAEQANHVGDDLLADVGFGEQLRIARTVLLELGDPVTMATKTIDPLALDAAAGPHRGASRRWRPTWRSRP